MLDVAEDCWTVDCSQPVHVKVSFPFWFLKGSVQISTLALAVFKTNWKTFLHSLELHITTTAVRSLCLWKHKRQFFLHGKEEQKKSIKNEITKRLCSVWVPLKQAFWLTLQLQGLESTRKRMHIETLIPRTIDHAWGLGSHLLQWKTGRGSSGGGSRDNSSGS